jgi:hypothetical protein
MSFTKSKYDNCFIEQQKGSNKSIFDYVVDNSKYKNKSECNDFTPPFIAYIPTGVFNVDIENDLKGMNQPYTRCSSCKFTPELDKQNSTLNVTNKRECAHTILPKGYLLRN